MSTWSSCWQVLLLAGLGSEAERKRIMKNAKAYLSQVKERKDYIRYLEQDIERLDEEATSLRGERLSVLNDPLWQRPLAQAQ